MRKLLLLIVGVLLLIAPATMAQDEEVTLTILIDDTELAVVQTEALTAAFTEMNPNVTFEIELRPQGADGDNVVKTRLATGEMTDVFFYNSGSLLQALNPTQTLVDLSDQPFMENVIEAFVPTVSQGEGIYGVPFGTAMGGGILYNKAIYAELGLEVPLTWDEFVANNAAIAEAGYAPVIATFDATSTWTSQLFVLGDYYNVEQAVPGFAEMYTANEAHYADTPAASAGFAHLQQGYELGWWQEDYATTAYGQGLDLLATGQGAHYPMLMFALPTIAENYPDAINDIGFFAIPGDDPEANGATIWMPGGAYIPQTTEGANLDAALEFLGFIASVEGTDVLTSVSPPNGPYLIVGATLPDDVLPAVQDLAVYIDSGNSFPALEFLSPVKGPNLEQLCIAVATGQMSAEEAAENYDFDVQRQAQQLGLPGW